MSYPCVKTRFSSHRSGVEVSLAFPAQDTLQKLRLCFGFDAFRDDAQAKTEPHGHDCRRYRFRVHISRQVTYKGLIDFQSINSKLAQIGQAGIAGAKVVDSYFHPKRIQLAQLLQRRLHLLHDYAFGKLEL